MRSSQILTAAKRAFERQVRIADERLPGGIYVAEHGGSVVGFSVLMTRMPSSGAYVHQPSNRRNEGVVNSLWAGCDSVGLRAGRELVNHAMEFFVSNGCERLIFRPMTAREPVCTIRLTGPLQGRVEFKRPPT